MGFQPLRAKRLPQSIRAPVITADLDPEDLPEQMSLFVGDIMALLTCLNEFPEFVNERVNAPITAFQADLKVGMETCPSPRHTCYRDRSC